ncbi:MAG: hypothetical protein D6767_02265 [Candidatus Hydrogenedentota bacterium]|nr:MAG: hypothetical protein D6767_02265 [Candidatus Hydrogenedentota bacterium]
MIMKKPKKERISPEGEILYQSSWSLTAETYEELSRVSDLMGMAKGALAMLIIKKAIYENDFNIPPETKTRIEHKGTIQYNRDEEGVPTKVYFWATKEEHISLHTLRQAGRLSVSYRVELALKNYLPWIESLYKKYGKDMWSEFEKMWDAIYCTLKAIHLSEFMRQMNIRLLHVNLVHFRGKKINPDKFLAGRVRPENFENGIVPEDYFYPPHRRLE